MVSSFGKKHWLFSGMTYLVVGTNFETENTEFTEGSPRWARGRGTPGH